MENQSISKKPTEFLNNVLGKSVHVKLNSGISYKGTLSFRIESISIRTCFLNGSIWLGTLACLDGYMNIALENTEEYVEDKLVNKYGDTFIRGNNGNV